MWLPTANDDAPSSSKPDKVAAAVVACFFVKAGCSVFLCLRIEQKGRRNPPCFPRSLFLFSLSFCICLYRHFAILQQFTNATPYCTSIPHSTAATMSHSHVAAVGFSILKRSMGSHSDTPDTPDTPQGPTYNLPPLTWGLIAIITLIFLPAYLFVSC
jgi:hypothetical protein